MAESTKPAEERPFVTRPLRTGTSFTVVIPDRRAVAGQWDKIDYKPGETCKLSVVGAGLGKDDLELAVEVEQDGEWKPIARLKAPVDDDGKKAEASWTAPDKLVQPAKSTEVGPDGSYVSDAAFENNADLERDGPVWMSARAVGFEGQSLQLVLEREEEPGKWLSEGEAASTVQSGKLRASVTPTQGE
jgi:hypothetical protein